MIGRHVARCAAIAAIGCSFLLPLWVAPPTAFAADLKVMSTVALNATLDDLKPKFETATGNKLTIDYSVIQRGRCITSGISLGDSLFPTLTCGGTFRQAISSPVAFRRVSGARGGLGGRDRWP